MEEDFKNEIYVYRYPLPTPQFLKPREALVRSKTLRNFPEPGKIAVFNSSVTRDDYPATPDLTVRVDLTVSGFVFEDIQDGC